MSTPSSSRKKPRPTRRPGAPSATADAKRTDRARDESRVQIAQTDEARATPTLHDLCLGDRVRTMPHLLTKREVADLLFIDPQVIARCVRRGDLRAVRFADGGASPVMIPRDELLRWIDSRQVRVSAVKYGRKPSA